MELRRRCEKHQATDRLWSLVVMVYVLCRTVGDLGPPKMLDLTGQTISPGKKAAARGSGSDGSSQPPIADAMRAAVAKVLAVAAAAQQAAAAVLTARARRPAVRPVVRPAVRPANEMT
jgi:hypothetical protein